jgi:hypothetical protein
MSDTFIVAARQVSAEPRFRWAGAELDVQAKMFK